MGYDLLEFTELKLRENGIRRIYVDKEKAKNNECLLCVDADNCYIGITISTYEQTRRDLEKELSLTVENVRQISVTLNYFDQIWDNVEEYVNESREEEAGGQVY